MDDLISRQAAISLAKDVCVPTADGSIWRHRCIDPDKIRELPPVEPTLYGYNIKHLELIARVLQKEDLPPERIVEVLTDIGRIVAIVRDEFEEALRKAVEQCVTQSTDRTQ